MRFQRSEVKPQGQLGIATVPGIEHGSRFPFPSGVGGIRPILWRDQRHGVWESRRACVEQLEHMT